MLTLTCTCTCKFGKGLISFYLRRGFFFPSRGRLEVLFLFLFNSMSLLNNEWRQSILPLSFCAQHTILSTGYMSSKVQVLGFELLFTCQQHDHLSSGGFGGKIFFVEEGPTYILHQINTHLQRKEL